MPTFGPHDLLSDRTILSRPSFDVAMCLLEDSMKLFRKTKITANVAIRLVAALAACAQVSSLGAEQRMWALKRLRFFLREIPPYCLSDTAANGSNGEHAIGSRLIEGRCRSPSDSPAESPIASPVRNNLQASGSGDAASSLHSSSSGIVNPAPAIYKGIQRIPELLWKQYDYEEPIVRSGKHLMHSPFFKVNWAYFTSCPVGYPILKHSLF
jgi:E3 ubiquitin-protein ligase HERC2